MPDSSQDLEAATRALHGESAPDVVLTALNDWWLSRALALAESAHHVVRTLAALRGDLITLIDRRTVADPDVRAAVQRLIGTREGYDVLWGWARVAPGGQEADAAPALMHAVQSGTCDPSVAAALIGPCDASAELLHAPQDIAFAIQRWGDADPDHPTAWMSRISPAIIERLCDVLRQHDQMLASCIPWLSPKTGRIADMTDAAIRHALESFAEAPSRARTRHAMLVQQLVAWTQPEHVNALVRLACVMKRDNIWDRVCELLHANHDAALMAVTAAPWDDLASTVHATILNEADTSDMCAAIAVARGERTHAPITSTTSQAFFAALDADVWDALNADTRQAWIRALWKTHGHLAVRSIGLRAEILAHVALTNDLILSAQRHTHDMSILRAKIYPLALRTITPACAHALIMALPDMPTDPGTFFCIAGGCSRSDVVDRARTTLRSLDDLAMTIVLQRSAREQWSIPDTCMTLRHALRGRTWEDLTPMLALLGEHDHRTIMPDRHALAKHLAHPAHHDAMLHALDRIATLPPDIAIPALYALERGRTDHSPLPAAEGVALALQDHGVEFLSIVDALNDQRLRAALLLLPDNPKLADALRAFAQDDVIKARNLAQALWTNVATDIHAALHAAPAPHAAAILNLMATEKHGSLPADLEARLFALTTDEDPESAHAMWRRLVRTDPAAAFALATLNPSSPGTRQTSMDMLAAHLPTLRTILPLLHRTTIDLLRSHPAIAATIADLSSNEQTRPVRHTEHGRILRTE